MDSFEHVNLNTIDPTTAPFTKSTYTLQVTDAYMKEFEYKKGERAGEKDKFIKLVLAITNSDRYTGRKVYASLFNNKGTLIQLRRIMDATGIPQEVGTPMDEWLTSLKESKATFNAPVGQEDVRQSDGTTRKSLVANLWEVAPAA